MITLKKKAGDLILVDHTQWYMNMRLPSGFPTAVSHLIGVPNDVLSTALEISGCHWCIDRHYLRIWDGMPAQSVLGRCLICGTVHRDAETAAGFMDQR